MRGSGPPNVKTPVSDYIKSQRKREQRPTPTLLRRAKAESNRTRAEAHNEDYEDGLMRARACLRWIEWIEGGWRN